jgi:hypothetical protein
VYVTELVEASLRFPTVIFTIGLGIALIYWAFVLLGALDIDLLGGGDVAGAGKGIGDLGGAAKGIGDVAGAAKGAGEALGGGGGDGDVGKSGGSGGGLLGLGSVPITISLSFVLLGAWCASLLGMFYGASILGDGVLLALAVLVLALLLALPIAAILVKPLAPVFAVREGKSNRDYVGHVCTVTTGHVDADFGQATIEDGATVLVIPVRCDRTGAFTRGAKALIVDFDDTRQAYIVEPAGELTDLPVT